MRGVLLLAFLRLMLTVVLVKRAASFLLATAVLAGLVPAAAAEPRARNSESVAAGLREMSLTSISVVADEYQQTLDRQESLSLRAEQVRGQAQHLAAERRSLSSSVSRLTALQQSQQQAVDANARSAYMSGISSEVSTLVDLVTSSDPVRTARSAAYVDSVAGFSNGDLERSRQRLRAVRERQALVTARHVSALATAARLESSADRAAVRLDELAKVIADVAFPAPDTGPQKVVSPEACPSSAPKGSFRAMDADVYELCAKSVRQAATPAAALAIIEAFSNLGAPYACDGVGRLEPGIYDCSSFVTRAYWEGAGVPVANKFYAPSTRSMMPWDGYAVNPWFAFVDPQQTRPGDLAVQRTCTEPPCDYQHVVMLLADGYQIHTSACGDVANVSPFAGFDAPSFAVARRIVAPGVSSAAVSSAVRSVINHARDRARAAHSGQ